MLDLHRLIGFVWHSRSTVMFRKIKDRLLETMPLLDSDDVAVVIGEHCEGSAETTAAISNAKQLENEDDFINMTKAMVKSIGEVDLDSPKLVFIISDDFSKEMEHTIYKLRNINEKYSVGSQLYFIQISDTAICKDEKCQRTIVSNTKTMVEEISRVLEEMNVV